MEKIKQVFSPGHKTDDNVMYGSGETPQSGKTATEGNRFNESSTGRTSTAGDNSSNLYPSSREHQSTTGSSGLTGSAYGSDKSGAAGIPPHMLAPANRASSSESIRSGVVGAATQPSTVTDASNADYSSGHSSTLADRSTGRSGLEGNTAAGGIGSTGPDTDSSRDHSSRDQTRDTQRSFPLSSSTTAEEHKSHLGRDAALAGGAGAAGAGAYETGKHHHHEPSNSAYGSGYDGTSSQQTTGRSQGLGSAMSTSNTTGQSHFGRDAGVASGLGAGAGASALASEHAHKGHGHDFSGDPCSGEETSGPAGYPQTTGGPHQLDTANRLDPNVDYHVPGEYPGASGEDHHRSHVGRDAGLAGAAGAAGAGAYEAHKHHGASSGPTSGISQNTSSTGTPPFTGAGGYDDQRFDPSSTHQTGTQASSIGYPSSTSQTREDHTGRNAALGTGAAGVAGVGAYEGLKHSRGDETGPASKTVGPHDSNVANVLDPRVLPQPAQQNDHYTSGPHHSNMANTMDPRYDAKRHEKEGTVPQNPATTGGNYSQDAAFAGAGIGSNKTQQTRDLESDKQHHYGRDAAVAGGAGAAGLGAYELGKDHDSSHLGAPSSTQQPLATPTGAPRDARVFDQTQRVPESQQQSAGWATDSKAQEKLEKERYKQAEKAQKDHEHSMKKAEKEHEKDYKKAEAAHEKNLAKAEHAHDKDLKREESPTEEKRSLVDRILHRHKDSTEDAALVEDEKKSAKAPTGRVADQEAHIRHQHELDAAAAAGGIGVAGAQFEPTAEQQLNNPYESSALTSERDGRVSTDEYGHNRLHKEPPAKVQRELEQRAGHEHGQSNIVTEPRTGLPMDLSKGTGQGGTDGNPIPGYHTQ